LVSVAILLTSQELITGAERKFVPGDKVVFQEDFSGCPVGELPASFDKLDGMGECVRFGDSIYFASIKDHARLIKSLDLGEDEFSIEYDLFFLKGECAESEVLLWDGDKPGEGATLVRFTVGPGCTGDAVYSTLEGVGRVFKSDYKSLKKLIHVALQVRRKQLRIYINGKRVAMKPFKGHVKSVGWVLHGEYSELLTNIRIGKYSSPEEKPKPELLGIKVQKTESGTTLTVPEKVLFDFNEFFLNPEAKKALHVVAEILRENPDKKVLVVGYTDNVGSDEYNMLLSLQRAQSVADFLIYVEGIDRHRIKIEGRGKENPIADNSTPEGRAQNRRVEIEILK